MCLFVTFCILLTVQVSPHDLMLSRLWTDRRARNVCLEDEVRLGIQEHRHRNAQHSQQKKSLMTAFVLEILYFMDYHRVIRETTGSVFNSRIKLPPSHLSLKSTLNFGAFFLEIINPLHLL